MQILWKYWRLQPDLCVHARFLITEQIGVVDGLRVHAQNFRSVSMQLRELHWKSNWAKISASLPTSTSLSFFSAYLNIYAKTLPFRSAYLYIFVYLGLSLHLCLSLHPCLSLPISAYLYISAYLCLSLPISTSLPISAYLYISVYLSLSLPIATSLPISAHLYSTVYLCLFLS